MSEHIKEDICSTCGHYSPVRMGEKHQYICEDCDNEQKLFATLKDAARKRPPSEKPGENGQILIMNNHNQFSLWNWNDEKGWNGFEVLIKWWVPISHLIVEHSQ